MKGDKLVIKDFHKKAAQTIYEKIEKMVDERKVTVSVAGESGSGKSEIAHCLAEKFAQKKTIILCQDDYFRLPPKTNHKNRVKDIANVGTQEVRLDKLDADLEVLQKMQERQLKKPLVDFDNDEIGQETIQVEDFALIIAEGTYTSLLKNVDVRCFIDKSYLQTKKNRELRGRDPMSGFVERVLEIEHKLIAEHKKFADIIL